MEWITETSRPPRRKWGSEMSDLKRCPFCGSHEDVFLLHDADCYLRMLEETKIEDGCHSAAMMEQAWNRRADDVIDRQTIVDIIREGRYENDLSTADIADEILEAMRPPAPGPAAATPLDGRRRDGRTGGINGCSYPVIDCTAGISCKDSQYSYSDS